MSRSYKRPLTVLVALLGISGGTAVDAQEGSSTVLIEEIVVTAQKREQSLKDVPMSIAAIDSQTLDDSGSIGIQDLAQLAPGLLFGETVGRQTTTPAIRGIAPASFSDPTVAVMVDGYTSGFQRQGNNATLFDLERIEVLRGPQATLYGRNAIGGVINYITRKPDNDLRGGIRLEVADHETRVIQGSISGPLVQNRLYAGVALGQRESGGFLDNDFTGETDVNDEEDLNARFSLRATPSDSWDIHLTVDYNEADDAAGDPSYAYHEFYLSDSPPTPEDIGSGRVNLNSYGRTISQDFLGGFDREESTVVLNIEYDFEWATLTSITGKSNQETSIRASLSRLPVRVIDFDILWDIESLSQEFRLTSNGGGRTHWQVGAYYFDNSRERTAILDFLNGQGWQEFPSTLDEVQNKAIFGNVEYGITDSLSMRLGLRYDTEDRTQSIPSTGASLSADNDEMLWSVSLTYQPSDFMTLYSTISKGYHAGGPNALDAVALGAPESYEPEFLTNYEAGIKGTSPSNSFGYEIAVFFMDWEDQQLFTEFDVINSASRFIVNAGQSEVYGMEMSLRYQPSEQLSISGALSYLQTEYLEFVNEIDAPAFGLDPDLAGNILPYSPELSASMSIQHISPFGSTGWDVRARGDLAYVGERAFDATNLFIANSHTLLNLYLGLQNDRYEIGAFVDNLGDERYLTGGVVPSNGNPPLATIGDPRTWGVRFRMTF